MFGTEMNNRRRIPEAHVDKYGRITYTLPELTTSNIEDITPEQEADPRARRNYYEFLRDLRDKESAERNAIADREIARLQAKADASRDRYDAMQTASINKAKTDALIRAGIDPTTPPEVLAKMGSLNNNANTGIWTWVPKEPSGPGLPPKPIPLPLDSYGNKLPWTTTTGDATGTPLDQIKNELGVPLSPDTPGNPGARVRQAQYPRGYKPNWQHYEPLPDLSNPWSFPVQPGTLAADPTNVQEQASALERGVGFTGIASLPSYEEARAEGQKMLRQNPFPPGFAQQWGRTPGALRPRAPVPWGANPDTWTPYGAYQGGMVYDPRRFQDLNNGQYLGGLRWQTTNRPPVPNDPRIPLEKAAPVPVGFQPARDVWGAPGQPGGYWPQRRPQLLPVDPLQDPSMWFNY